MKKITALLILTHFAFNCFAQDQHLIDSLKTKLKNLDANKLELGQQSSFKFDTVEVYILHKLSVAYWGNDPDKSIEYAQQCQALSEKIGFKKGIGIAYHSIAANKGNIGDYFTALQFYKKALKIMEEIGDKKGIAGAYINSGNMYSGLGNYPKALEYFFKGLKIAEQIGMKQYMGNAYNSIGNVYFNTNNATEALKYFFINLKIMEEIDNKNGIANSYGNIGNVFNNQGNYPEALKNYFACLKIVEEIGDKIGTATSYNNIGDIYVKKGNQEDGLKNHFAALKIRQEIEDKLGMAMSYLNIGDTYTKQKKYTEAFEYLNKGLLLSKEISSLEMIKSSYDFLSKLDNAKGSYKEALDHYKLFITYSDSIENNENTKKTLALQMKYDFGKTQDSLFALQTKKDLMATSEKNKQRLLRNGFIGGFLVMLLFAGIFFRQRNKIKKGKNKSDELLLNILPSEVAEELKDTGRSKAKNFDEVTVLFTDFKNFTNISEKLTPEELVQEIDTCFSTFDNIIHKYGVEKIKTIGDAYMCAGGLPVVNNSHPEDVVKAALEIRDFMMKHNTEKLAKGEFPFEIRIGINTGPVVAGIVGVRKFAYDIWGDTVNLASRMESHGEVGKVNISESTFAFVKDKYNCAARGKIMTKSKGEIEMYFVEKKIEVGISA